MSKTSLSSSLTLQELTFWSDRAEIEFDYQESLSQKIEQGGFHHVDPEIQNRAFSSEDQGKKKKTIKLFHTLYGEGDYIPLFHPVTRIREEGYRAMNILELCDLASQYPYLQLCFPLVALNSMWTAEDFIYSPTLDNCTHSYKRQLALFRFRIEGEVIWPKYCRFPGIKIDPS